MGRLFIVMTAGLYRVKLNRVIKYERLFVILPECIHRMNQVTITAIVRIQCKAPTLINSFTGGHIGKDVTATESINCLLRITDHNQAMLIIRVIYGSRLIDLRRLIYTTEDSILNRIGVLKFIDHCNRVQSSDLCCQFFALLRLQSTIKKALEIITGDNRRLLKKVDVTVVNRTKPGQLLRLPECSFKFDQLINFFK